MCRGSKYICQKIIFPQLNGAPKKGKALSCKDVSDWVQEHLELEPSERYSERTIGKWLHQLGFSVTVSKKGIYYDGHERSDVVQSRKVFIEKYNYWREKSVQVDHETLELKNEDASYIMASLDEKAHHSNDVVKRSE